MKFIHIIKIIIKKAISLVNKFKLKYFLEKSCHSISNLKRYKFLIIFINSLWEKAINKAIIENSTYKL